MDSVSRPDCVTHPNAQLTAEELAAIQATAINQARQLQELIDRELGELQTPPKTSGLLAWLDRILPEHCRKGSAAGVADRRPTHS